MNRWNSLPYSNNNNPLAYAQNAAPILNFGEESPQHASIGSFIGQSLEGADSGYVRCVYTAVNVANSTVTVLCEKAPGCCEHYCCPKDQFWMAGVFVLLAFVLVVLVVGVLMLIICYQRSKSKQRQEEKEAYAYSGYGSQVGMYPAGGYASYVGGGSTAAPRY